MAISKRSVVVGTLFALLMFFTTTLDAVNWMGLGTIFARPSGVSCETTSSGLLWIPLAFVALLLGIAWAAFGWTLSGAFGVQRYSDFLKGLLWGLLETAAIISVLSLAFITIGPSSVATIDKARAYSVIIRNTVGLDFVGAVGVSMGFSWLSNAAPSLRPFGQNGFYLTFQVAPMFKPIYDLLGILLQLMTASLAQWFAHEFLLCFVKNQMLTLLLPLGIFLRAVGIKPGGNAIIGIALAFYFVYPIMMVQTGEIVQQHMANEIKALPPVQNTGIPAGMVQPVFEHVWGLACKVNQPICCVGTNIYPPNYETQFIPNGVDWRTNLNDRVQVESVLNGAIYLDLKDATSPSLGSGASCVFSTIPAKTYNAVTGIFSNPATFLIGGSWLSYKVYGKVLGGKDIKGIYSTPEGIKKKLAGATTSNKLPVMPILNWFNFDWVKLGVLYSMSSILFPLAYSVIYFLFIISLVMPIFVVFITITFAKEIAKVLGTEIDLSSLEKLI